MTEKINCGDRGFTLVEILLVVVIIGVLAAMVVPNFAGKKSKAQQAAAVADIEANLAVALDMYELDVGRFPITEQGLKALIEIPSTPPVPETWGGPYLKKKTIPLDPWGQEYNYRAPGTHNQESYDLFSYGADGVESNDDIVNWQKE
ncbi:MAG: type II secretion system major pseudopilin GspG [Candidatus Omnitrophota bacterium]|jgi:general secretion pathway protein G